MKTSNADSLTGKEKKRLCVDIIESRHSAKRGIVELSALSVKGLKFIKSPSFPSAPSH